MNTDLLTSASLKQIEAYGRSVLVIDGDCAAGKTTLAAQVAARLDCNLFHMDDFFLPPALRTDERLSEPGGNVHYERFADEVIQPLLLNRAFTYGAYSCATQQTTAIPVSPKPCTVIEGSYALHPRFLPAYQEMNALLFFLQVSSEVQIKRIQKRNGEAMLRRFKDEWIPMEKRYRQTFENQWNNVQFIDG